jgi:hypothetical protein
VLRLAASALLAAGVAAGTSRAAQDATAPADPQSGPSSPAPSPSPSPRRARPIRRSIDRQVEAVVRAHLRPCEAAWRQGVPCFPVSVEQEGPRFSVKEALRSYRPDGSPAPGVPTNAEMQRQMSGAPLSPSGGVSFDPACTAKSLVRQIKGRPNTFYLYRTWNGATEQPLLTDHKLDPNAFSSLPSFRYEFLGEFKGECEAIAAWRSALRRTQAPPPAEGEPVEQPTDPKPPR